MVNSGFLCRLKGMAQEVDRLQGAQRLRDTQWTGKEQSYKKTVEQLETKVGYLLPSTLARGI